MMIPTTSENTFNPKDFRATPERWKYVVFDSNETEDSVYSLAKGEYQRDLLTGCARWSGSDLKGTAAKYASKYARSRKELVARIKSAGYVVEFVKGFTQRLTCVIYNPGTK